MNTGLGTSRKSNKEAGRQSYRKGNSKWSSRLTAITAIEQITINYSTAVIVAAIFWTEDSVRV